jgi:hypothetical protein
MLINKIPKDFKIRVRNYLVHLLENKKEYKLDEDAVL